MVESVGKKLQQARLRGQISVDDAARSTRMRPGAIMDLENDDYTNFPNTAYAKGFLLIYAKYLGVDVSDFADAMGNANPVAVDEYEYLNAARHARPVVHRAPSRSLMPLAFLAIMLIAAAIVMYLIVSFQRLGGGHNLEQIAENKGTVPIPAPSASTAPRIASPPASGAAPAPGAAVSPAPSAVADVLAPPIADASASPAPAPSAVPVAAVSPSATPLPAIVTLTPLMKEIVLMPLKKTRVTIRKDVPDSPPVFEDFLYPDARPLKLRGTRFWIKMEDPAAIKITRDGQPVPSDQPNVTIE